MADDSPQPEIPAARMTAWRSLLSAQAALVSRVEKALAAEDLPPLSWYDVLSALHRDPQHAMRPRDLGCGVTISRSGMTRLLDRIEAAGLVERKLCDTDRRGQLVVLTEAGERMLGEMQPVYASELEAGFAGILSDEEAETLSGLLARVQDAAAPGIATPASSAD
jgi:DNA-binding MarR family transcriptional regulator